MIRVRAGIRIHAAIAAAVTVTVAILSGCSASTEPTAPSVTSSFSAQMVGGTYPPVAPTVQTTSTTILVDGVIATPTPCYKVSAATTAAHDTVVVQVTATTSATDACEEAIALWHYTVTMTPRPSGMDMIRVIHAAGSGQPSVVLEQPLGGP